MSWLAWYWPMALVFIAFVLFGIPEYAAIHYGGQTFSRWMTNVANSKFGHVWVFLWGLLVGGLVVHLSAWCMAPCGVTG